MEGSNIFTYQMTTNKTQTLGMLLSISTIPTLF